MTVDVAVRRRRLASLSAPTSLNSLVSITHSIDLFCVILLAFFTDSALAREVLQSPPSVCPSDCPTVSTLTFEPSER